MEIEIISKFLEIGKLQYTRIYTKLQRRNKLRSSGKLSNNTACTKDIKTLNLQ